MSDARSVALARAASMRVLPLGHEPNATEKPAPAMPTDGRCPCCLGEGREPMDSRTCRVCNGTGRMPVLHYQQQNCMDYREWTRAELDALRREASESGSMMWVFRRHWQAGYRRNYTAVLDALRKHGINLGQERCWDCGDAEDNRPDAFALGQVARPCRKA